MTSDLYFEKVDSCVSTMIINEEIINISLNQKTYSYILLQDWSLDFKSRVSVTALLILVLIISLNHLSNRLRRFILALAVQY